jgi:hypothetical protein
MAKLIMVWLFGAAVFTFGNVYAAGSDRPADEDAIGTLAKITLIQAILDDEDEDEDLQDDEDLQEDEEDTGDERDGRDERDGQNDLEGEDDQQEDEEDQEDSSLKWATPT